MNRNTFHISSTVLIPLVAISLILIVGVSVDVVNRFISGNLELLTFILLFGVIFFITGLVVVYNVKIVFETDKVILPRTCIHVYTKAEVDEYQKYEYHVILSPLTNKSFTNEIEYKNILSIEYSPKGKRNDNKFNWDDGEECIDFYDNYGRVFRLRVKDFGVKKYQILETAKEIVNNNKNK